MVAAICINRINSKDKAGPSRRHFGRAVDRPIPKPTVFLYMFGPPTDCGDLTNPTNGAVTINPNKTSGTYTCNPGYALNGVETRNCSVANGGWDGSEPTCGRNNT